MLVRSQSKVVRLFRIVSFLILHFALPHRAHKPKPMKCSQKIFARIFRQLQKIAIHLNKFFYCFPTRRSPIESARREKETFMLVFQCVIKNLFLFSRIELFFQVFLHSLCFLRPISCVKEKRKKKRFVAAFLRLPCVLKRRKKSYEYYSSSDHLPVQRIFSAGNFA